MKITKVDVLKLTPDPTRTGWHPIVCRVYTDAGIYGDGEAGMAYDTGAMAAFGMVQDAAQQVLGMDPLDNEVIWEKLYKSTFWAQNGGPVFWAGISAIDTALWDIKGKFFGVPVYKLLGGKMRSKLRCYASQLQFGWGESRTPACTLQDYVDAAKKAVDEGYDALKYDFFTFAPDGRGYTWEDTARQQTPENLQVVIGRIAAVREAVGPNVEIMIENHANTDAQSAVQLGQLAEPYNIMYFEEPTTPTPKLNKFVSDRVNIPIAHGERIYSRWGYA